MRCTAGRACASSANACFKRHTATAALPDPLRAAEQRTGPRVTGSITVGVGGYVTAPVRFARGLKQLVIRHAWAPPGTGVDPWDPAVRDVVQELTLRDGPFMNFLDLGKALGHDCTVVLPSPFMESAGDCLTTTPISTATWAIAGPWVCPVTTPRTPDSLKAVGMALLTSWECHAVLKHLKRAAGRAGFLPRRGSATSALSGASSHGRRSVAPSRRGSTPTPGAFPVTSGGRQGSAGGSSRVSDWASRRSHSSPHIVPATSSGHSGEVGEGPPSPSGSRETFQMPDVSSRMLLGEPDLSVEYADVSGERGGSHLLHFPSKRTRNSTVSILSEQSASSNIAALGGAVAPFAHTGGSELLAAWAEWGNVSDVPLALGPGGYLLPPLSASCSTPSLRRSSITPGVYTPAWAPLAPPRTRSRTTGGRWGRRGGGGRTAGDSAAGAGLTDAFWDDLGELQAAMEMSSVCFAQCTVLPIAPVSTLTLRAPADLVQMLEEVVAAAAAGSSGALHQEVQVFIASAPALDSWTMVDVLRVPDRTPLPGHLLVRGGGGRRRGSKPMVGGTPIDTIVEEEGAAGASSRLGRTRVATGESGGSRARGSTSDSDSTNPAASLGTLPPGHSKSSSGVGYPPIAFRSASSGHVLSMTHTASLGSVQAPLSPTSGDAVSGRTADPAGGEAGVPPGGEADSHMQADKSTPMRGDKRHLADSGQNVVQVAALTRLRGAAAGEGRSPPATPPTPASDDVQVSLHFPCSVPAALVRVMWRLVDVPAAGEGVGDMPPSPSAT